MEKPNKRFVVGDIHGGYLALLQCIAMSGIDKEKDQLIVLGDVADGWHETQKCVAELLTFDNLIAVRGNHDQWFMDWIKTGKENQSWLRQGGKNTLKSYMGEKDVMEKHFKEYFKKSIFYYIDEKKNLFVHGGFDWHIPIEDQPVDELMWNRHTYQTALQWETYATINPTEKKTYFKDYNKVFVGHTTTTWNLGWRYESGTKPVFASNLINLDTGGGYEGKLTIMDVDSHEYWQSDNLSELYPKEFNSRV